MPALLRWIIQALLNLRKKGVDIETKVLTFLTKVKLPAKAAAFRPTELKDLTVTRLKQLFAQKNWTMRDVLVFLLEGASVTWGLWSIGDWLISDNSTADEIRELVSALPSSPHEKQALIDHLDSLNFSGASDSTSNTELDIGKSPYIDTSSFTDSMRLARECEGHLRQMGNFIGRSRTEDIIHFVDTLKYLMNNRAYLDELT